MARSIGVVLFLVVLAIGGGILWNASGDPTSGDESVDPVGTLDEGELDEDAHGDKLENGDPAAREDGPAGVRVEPAVAKTVSDAEKIRVFGSVVDRGGKPAAGKKIDLFHRKPSGYGFSPWGISFGGKPAETAETDATGRFAFRIPKGRTGGVRFAGDEWVFKNKLVPFGASSDDIDLGELRLVKAGVLAGVVRDRRKQPLEGVQVQAWTTDYSHHGKLVKTDAEGRFRLTGLSAGKFWVSTSSAKHLSKRLEVTLAAEERKETLEVELEDGVAISGRVVDDRGLPVADARISGYSHRRKSKNGKLTQEWEHTQGSTKSDAGGYFSIAVLEGGTMQLSATKKGFRPKHPGKSFKPGAGAVVLTLVRNATIVGRLMTRDGKPVAGSRVWAKAMPKKRGSTPGNLMLAAPGDHLMAHSGAASKRVKTDDDGQFRIDNVPPGQVAVHATGAHRDAKLENLTVHPGKTLKGIEIFATKGFKLEVRVVDPAGEPLAGASVVVAKKAAAAAAAPNVVSAAVDGSFMMIPSFHGNAIPAGAKKKTTDKDGRAVFYGLDAGPSEVTATHASYAASDKKTVTVAAEGELATELSVKVGSFVDVVTRSQAGKAAGNLEFFIEEVKDAKPAASPAARMRVFPGQGAKRISGRTDAKGRSRVGPLTAGRYTAVLKKPRTSKMRHYYFGPYGAALTIETSRVPFEVREGAPSQVTLTMPLLTKLTGRISRSNGPMVGATIELRVQKPKSKKRQMWAWTPPAANVKTDQEGNYEVAGLEHGTYVLTVRRSGMAVPIVDEVEIPPNVEAHRHDLSLALGSLRVRVTNKADAAGVAGVRVSLTPAKPDPRTRHGTLQGIKTDPSGMALLEDVPPGRYNATIRKNGHATQRIDGIDIGAGAVVERSAQLVPSPAIRLKRLDASGAATRGMIRYREDGVKNRYQYTGSKVVNGLAPGVWWFQVRGPRQNGKPAPWGPEVKVDVRGTKPIDVTLRTR